MKGTILHIGKEQSKRKTARYKRLVNSGIFRNQETISKAIDCKGNFENWSNQPAKDWIYARVKEITEGRDIDISCNCCKHINHQTNINSWKKEEMKTNMYVNKECHAPEIINLIIKLSKINNQYEN